MSDEPRKKNSSYDPSRRKFLKGVGVAGAGAALADSLLSHDVTTARRWAASIDSLANMQLSPGVRFPKVIGFQQQRACKKSCVS